ncbi:hypothetical protein Dimus_031810 [Dionaea muscipula]
MAYKPKKQPQHMWKPKGSTVQPPHKVDQPKSTQRYERMPNSRPRPQRRVYAEMYRPTRRPRQQIRFNLLSKSQFCDKGYLVEFSKEVCKVKNEGTDLVVLTGRRKKNMYVVD